MAKKMKNEPIRTGAVVHERFAHLRVATSVPVEVGTLFDQHHVRHYRDERGEQVETFTYRCRVTSVQPYGLDYETVGEPTNVVNPFKNFAKVNGGGIMNFGFNDGLAKGTIVIVKGE